MLVQFLFSIIWIHRTLIKNIKAYARIFFYLSKKSCICIFKCIIRIFKTSQIFFFRVLQLISRIRLRFRFSSNFKFLLYMNVHICRFKNYFISVLITKQKIWKKEILNLHNFNFTNEFLNSQLIHFISILI